MDNVLYISGVPTSDHENVNNKVLSVIKDGCRVKDIKVTDCHRKKGYNGKPGVIMAKLENKAHVDKVMDGVKNLKQSKNHKRIFLNRHQSLEVRAMKANAQALLKACGKDKDFTFKGQFLVKKPQNS
mgnify:FL=1